MPLIAGTFNVKPFLSQGRGNFRELSFTFISGLKMDHSLSKKTWAIHFLLYTCLSATSSALFAQKNGNITLKANIKQGIQEILWKFKGNKVADWDEESGVKDYLQFKGRISLVPKTGDLTIFSLKSEDTGLYEGELVINENIHTVKDDLIIIDPVSKSSIACKINDDGNATLLCQAEGPHLSYSWSGPGLKTGFIGQIGPNISRVENTNSDYSCVVKNPVSEMTEYFRAADCFAGQEEIGGGSWWFLLFLFFVILVVILVIISWKRCSKESNHPACKLQGIDDEEENGHRETDNSTSPPLKSPLPLPLKPVLVDEEAKMETNITTSTPPQVNKNCLPVPPKPQVPSPLKQNNAAHSEESCSDMANDIDGGEKTETSPLLKSPPPVPPKPLSAGIPQNNATISEQNGKERGTEAKMETNFASPQDNPSYRPPVAPKPQNPPFSPGSGPNEEEGIQVVETHITTPETTAPTPPPKPSRLDSSQNADANPAEDTDEA
ncbi:uncharacterized protein LOC121713759 isoform X2 [Alosa sapidissima]|uniref:uncharacterized protein LOC121713759 isoform X2 n=1 Tax=Alosa sapidissima TaxID=34773 RepID=UPI001C09537F|nr:uncharacterized protein LOC121713759 isoform X2 [Alosa sapidissima]